MSVDMFLLDEQFTRIQGTTNASSIDTFQDRLSEDNALQRVRELASHPHFLRYSTPISKKKKNNNKMKKTKRGFCDFVLGKAHAGAVYGGSDGLRRRWFSRGGFWLSKGAKSSGYWSKGFEGFFGRSVKTCPNNKSMQKEVQIEKEKEVEQGEEEGMGSLSTDNRLEIDQEKAEKLIETQMTNRLEALYISSNEVTEKSEVQEHQTCEMEQAPLVERSVGVESPVSGEVQEGSIEEKEEEKEKEKEWLDVSPRKSSRSPLKNLKFDQVAILTNSRFSVLSSEEEGEIVGEQSEECVDVDEEVCASLAKKDTVIPRQSLPKDSKLKHKSQRR
ncbi:hypothetical protein F2Q69_00047591 [Brassica cretica]|uniref:Uncharacterized protein n=1 Tax=Brassica cretica TaxID=69181 RepID=A0A8S9PIH3_BRACR|nr:hypothetical protein F2Q69_00047591 [Brassica cretica]